ncbi:MAG: 16S rRNA (adenine(1518)-N(6)/adenine(1519)-N(6))-dimethyltransferase RsmA [Planctomycetota bacterium]
MNRAELRRHLEEAGIRLRKAAGQNFLVEDDLAAAIARDGGAGPADVVLEVGTGAGILTRHLAGEAGHVLSVELDERVHALAGRLLADLPNVTLLRADALEGKAALNPVVLSALAERLGGGKRLRVVANLPYNVATPLVVLLLAAELPLDAVVVMVQLEAAQRFAARPGEEGFGAVSLLCAALSERVELVRRVPPEVFFPRPSVSSAVVRLVPRPGRQTGFPRFSQVVRGLFNYRRKTLTRAAHLAAAQDPGLAGLPQAVAGAGLGSVRVEEISLDQARLLAGEGPHPLSGQKSWRGG